MSVEAVDRLTWFQVEELYLKPQIADNEAIRVDGGGDSGRVTAPASLPGTFAAFAAFCRSNGMAESEVQLRAIYESSKGAKR